MALDSRSVQPSLVIAAVLTLIPLVAAAFFFGETLDRAGSGRLLVLRLVCPALLCVPYALVAASGGIFRWGWFGLYAALPVGVAALLWRAGEVDGANRGDWRGVSGACSDRACSRSALVRARMASASRNLQQDAAAGCRDLWLYPRTAVGGGGI